MSKKLLAVLVAMSACLAFGCSDDDSSDDACTTGAKKCEAGIPSVCVNGVWKAGTKCENGCDATTNVCKAKAPETGDCKNAGEKRCSVDQLQVCTNGQWTKDTDCANGCDATTKACKDDDTTTCTGEKVTTGGTVGQCCDKATYQQTCINGNANALVCWDGAVKEWTCANNECAANTEAGKELQVVCKKDSSGGSTGGETTSCTGEKVTTGGTVGQCCDKATYQQTCINGNANALVCWDGAVKEWTCADNECAANTEAGKELHRCHTAV